MAPDPAELPAGRRLSPAALVIAVAGLGLSAYLTAEHYGGNTSLACPQQAAIDCLKVTTSRWSEIASIPVAVLGLAYFAAMVVLLLPPLGRRREWDVVRLAAAGVGVAMVLYLVSIELFAVDAICLWCTAVHLCTVALFAVLLWRFGERRA